MSSEYIRGLIESQEWFVQDIKAKNALKEATESVIKQPGDCHFFMRARELLMPYFNDAKSPYASMATGVLGEITTLHNPPDGSNRNNHIPSCYFGLSTNSPPFGPGDF